MKIAPFPPGFRFGVATADHQCESYVKGQDDVRDLWEGVRGLVPRGSATDFWNRYREDIELARRLGCTIFRISLSWARLEPQAGVWSEAGFDHYRNVLTEIRQAGMATVVTLHHNTWPLHIQALDGGAGMLSASFPNRFASYAGEVARRLGDLIDYYITLNEPNQLIYGYLKPWWMRSYPMPPGLDRFATVSDQMSAVLKLIPNLFLAHARARASIRHINRAAPVGANPFLLGFPPWLQRIIDRNATRVRQKRDLQRQGRRVSQRPLLEFGAVDIVIAQMTMNPERMDDVLFSESYLMARFAALVRDSLPDRELPKTWRGRAGVTAATTAEGLTKMRLPAAEIVTFRDLAMAVDALRAGTIDAVCGDDFLLRPHASDGLTLKVFSHAREPYAIGMAPGNRTLLNAVDLALRAFKKSDGGGPSPWARSFAASFPSQPIPDPPITGRRATLADVGASKEPAPPATVPHLDGSLATVLRRGVLRVGVHEGAQGLCMRNAAGAFAGLEIDLAQHTAASIFGEDSGHVEFTSLHMNERTTASRSWLRILDPLFRATAAFTTILTTNWWNLGLAGRLDPILCPPECVGALDFVGLDFYWAVDTFRLHQITRLLAAAEGRYARAPVWPSALYDVLLAHHRMFPNLPIIVVENGCVTAADGIARKDYLIRHIAQVQRAVEAGVPVQAYLCWSITSNREWGLPFDDSSDFGLYHIDLDRDPSLTRVETTAAEMYRHIIAARSAV